MPKRADISKILILGFGCIAAAGTGWIATAGVAVAECVTVTPNYEPSSSNVRIATLRDGKPLQNVKINLDTTGGQRSSLTTNAQGIVFLPKLRPEKHCIIATALDGAVAQLCIDVSSSKHKRSSFSIELPPSPAMQELARAENMPVRDRVQEFSGTVQDPSPSGDAVPGTKIQILLKGSKDETHAIQIEADASGHFLAHLPEGVYMAFFRSPGFDTQIEVFEIGKGLDSKDLRITLKIGWC